MITGAEEKLNNIIKNGQSRVASVLQNIQYELQERQDIIAKPEAIKFGVDSDNLFIDLPNQQGVRFSNHSENQLHSKLHLPRTFSDRLILLKENDLLIENLNTLNKHYSKDGVLLRKVNGTIKGFLSPAYKRMDAPPIFETFVKSSIDNGYVPYEGYNTDYRYQLRFIHPEIFQPIENEHVVFGLSITSGDYGNQALELEMLILRIICQNLALGMDLFRKVHLGSRFNIGDEEIFTFSDKTANLDVATISSAVNDVVEKSKDYVLALQKNVESAVNKEGNLTNALGILKRKGFAKEILQQVETTYNNKALPIEILPSKDSAWRLSNTISFIANQLESDIKIDLQKEAMEVLI